MDCPLLAEIPNIQGLQTLHCYDCPLLKEIPNIQGLQTLDCSGCPLLTEIPNIQGLQKLYCFQDVICLQKSQIYKGYKR